MNKAEKIKAEIERLKNELIQEAEKGYKSEFDEGRISAFEDMITFIDSIEEDPVSNDLEEAAWMYYDKNKPLIPHELDLHKEMISFFIAGAQWQKEQTIDKACSFLHHYQEYPNHDITTDKLVEAFKMYIEL